MNYTADFETIVDSKKTRIWAWGICEIGSNYKFDYGNSDKSFIEWIKSLNRSTKVYFHNLKFDGKFLLYMLHKFGYEFYQKESEKDRSLPVGKYTTLINADGGMWYSVKLCTKRKGKNPVIIEFLDSSKIIPGSVERIAKDFGLEEQKGELDYKEFREVGHELKESEIDYLKRDVTIMAKALNIMFDKKLTKMTIGSNALGSFKQALKRYEYRQKFPILEYDRDVRQSYRGGWTYCKTDKKEKDLGKVVSLDVNSLYPWAMYDNLLPVGEGVPFRGEYEFDPLYPLYIMQVQLNFEIKKDHLPTIQIKDSFYNSTEWLESSDYNYPVICVTNVDWELIKDHYDLYNVEILGGWKFKGEKDLFKNYIDYWMGEKIKAEEENNPSMRSIAKLMLNNLYGKFGSKPYAREKYPVFDRDGFLHLVDSELTEKDPVYVPIASFITSYARDKTIRTAQSLYDRFIYSDTDSIHLLGWEIPDNVEVHPTKLGAWKIEDYSIRSRFIGAKCYYKDLVFDDEVVKSVTVAGLPESLHEQVTWENFHVGARYSGKLRPKDVLGGVYLEEIDYVIRKR